MPRLTVGVPRYRRHKPSGDALVCLNGQRIHLGKYNSPESRQLYDQLVADWLASRRQLAPVHVPKPQGEPQLVTLDAIVENLEHARAYYVKNGEPTSEV